MAEGRIDVRTLVAALDERKEARRLSWRKVAAEAGVSPSTLTRMQQGKLPDVNSFGALVSWLKVPAEHFLQESQDSGGSEERLSALASTLLRGKKEMSPKAVKALEELVRAAYRFSREIK